MAAWDRWRGAGETGIEGEIWSGRVFTPRFYCDDPTVGAAIAIYATKPPVCHLILTPRVQYLGQAIAWDISNSRSATSTISTYDIDWGGATDIGDISGALWTGDKDGSVVYDALGTYTVEAFVTDVLSKESQHVFITVEIVEPVKRLYIGTVDAGVFVSDNSGTPAASNSGLSGDDLKLRAIRLHPAYAELPAAQQHVWIVTKTGLAYSVDGAATWTKITEATLGTPANTAGDDPAPATGDLDQIDIAFDPQDERRIYLLRTWASPKRAWIYFSEDYGVSWENYQIGELT